MPTSTRALIIDFHAFQHPRHKFIVKELAAVDTETLGGGMWIFKPPYARVVPQSNNNVWIRSHLHGFEWSAGDVDYRQLTNILQSITENYTIILSKGYDKCRFLERILQKAVYDLAEYGCPNIDSLLKQSDNKPGCYYKCLYHSISNNPKLRCAVEQAYRLTEWYKYNNNSSSGGSESFN
jgi:hypothetical protein